MLFQGIVGRASLIRMTFEQGDLKEMRVQDMLMSGGREYQTDGTA